MAAAMDRTLNYRISLEDNVTPTAKAGSSAMKDAEAQTKKTTEAVVEHQVKQVRTLVALQAVRAGVSGITHGLSELGLVSDETEKKLRKVNAAVALIVGTGQLLKGLGIIYDALTAKTIALSSVETYRAIISSPAKLALVGAGLAAAGGAAGYFAGKSAGRREARQTDQVNQTINYYGAGPSQQSRGVQRASLEAIGGF